jgi:hypothetical protein
MPESGVRLQDAALMPLQRIPLADLEAEWRQVRGRPAPDCLFFLCPVCRGKKNHRILVATQRPSVYPGGEVWKVEGSRDLARVTLRPSIDLRKPLTVGDRTEHTGCTFHGRVRNGHVEWGD